MLEDSNTISIRSDVLALFDILHLQKWKNESDASEESDQEDTLNRSSANESNTRKTLKNLN